MQRHIEPSVWRHRRKRSLVARFALPFIAAGAVAAQAGDTRSLTSTIVVAEPSSASTIEAVVIHIGGESSDGCIPSLHAVNVGGEEIAVTLVHPGLLPCTQAFKPWGVDVNLGILPVGTYFVTVQTVALPPPLPSPPATAIGETSFTVVDSIAGLVAGATARRSVCRNRTTGQRVTVRSRNASVNCETAGLVVSPGDKVSIRMVGVAD